MDWSGEGVTEGGAGDGPGPVPKGLVFGRWGRGGGGVEAGVDGSDLFNHLFVGLNNAVYRLLAGFISLWLNLISHLLDVSEVLQNPGEAPPGFWNIGEHHS